MQSVVEDVKLPTEMKAGTSSQGEQKKRLQDPEWGPPKKKVRHYSEDYLQFGFVEDTNKKPVCVFCSTTLANEARNPSKLKRHLATNHPEYVDKPLAFFQIRKEHFESSKKVTDPTRHYSEEYLKFGFIEGPNSNLVCVLCSTRVTNSSLNPFELKRHLILNHPECIDKPLKFFQTKKKNFKDSDPSKVLEITAQHEEVSYEISKLIAEAGYPHSVAEELIAPALKIFTSRLGARKDKKEVMLQISNDTVTGRIDKMAQKIKETVLGHLKTCTYFALLLDQSLYPPEEDDFAFVKEKNTYELETPFLFCFVRYDWENTIREELLFCKQLSKLPLEGGELFPLIDSHITQNGVSWKKCVGFSSPSMLVIFYGSLFDTIENAAAYCITWIHTTEREQLVSSDLPLLLQKTLKECVKVVNYVKARPDSRIVSALCEEMGSGYEQLLFHTEMQWLSRGNVFKLLVDMKDDVRSLLDKNFFIEGEICELKHKFSDADWLLTVAYLSDIFDILDDLSKNLKGSSVTIFDVEDMKTCGIKRFEELSQRVQAGNYDDFTKLTGVLNEQNVSSMPGAVLCAIEDHLVGLEKTLENSLTEPDLYNSWIRNPFTYDPESGEVSPSELDSLITLSSDSALKSLFERVPLTDFWLSCLGGSYKTIAYKAVEYLMSFATANIREKAFAKMIFMRNNTGNRGDVEQGLRIATSSFSPDIKTLAQTSLAEASV